MLIGTRSPAPPPGVAGGAGGVGRSSDMRGSPSPNRLETLGQSPWRPSEQPIRRNILHPPAYSPPTPSGRHPLSRLLALALLTPTFALAEPAYQIRTLPNGLTVLVAEDPSTPLVTVEIGVKNGSMTESPEYNGLSHLYEHMFFKANAAIPSQEAYFVRTQELGIQWNGTTKTKRVNYFLTTTSDHLADAMVFMRDAIVSPLFDPKELERERVVVTGELDRNEATPGYHFWHTVEKRIWWKYPSYKDPLGSRQTVLHATRAQMQTIQQRYYVPNNSLLVVTGDVRAADIFAQADKLY